MKNTKVMECSCHCPQQDGMYGLRMGVHNAVGPKRRTAGIGWRCSVCCAEKPLAKGEART